MDAGEDISAELEGAVGNGGLGNEDEVDVGTDVDCGLEGLGAAGVVAEPGRRWDEKPILKKGVGRGDSKDLEAAAAAAAVDTHTALDIEAEAGGADVDCIDARPTSEIGGTEVALEPWRAEGDEPRGALKGFEAATDGQKRRVGRGCLYPDPLGRKGCAVVGLHMGQRTPRLVPQRHNAGRAKGVDVIAARNRKADAPNPAFRVPASVPFACFHTRTQISARPQFRSEAVAAHFKPAVRIAPPLKTRCWRRPVHLELCLVARQE